mgnify:CR=1 FL=1
MAGVIEFLIKMQDGLSSPLAKITQNSGNAKTALGTLTNTTTTTGYSVNQLKERITKLKELRDILPPSAEQKIRAYNTEINKLTRSLKNLETINGSKMKTWAKDAFGSLPAFLTNPLVLAGAGLGAALNQGLQQSREKLDFKLLLGDKGGEEMYKGIRELTPILGNSVQSVAKDLLGVGVATDKVKPLIEQLGAVARGDEAKFGALAGAFKEIQKEGKLTENTLSALNSAGFKPLTHISEKYNITMDDLAEKLAKGEIDINLVSEALERATGKGGEFEGVISKLSKEPSVVFAQMKQQVFDLAGAFGEAVLLPALAKTAELFEATVKWGKENADTLYIVGGALLSGVVAYKAYQTWQEISWLWSMRSVVAESLAATSKGYLTLATTGLTAATGALNAVFLASPIGLIVGGMMLIGGAVVWAWNKFEGFRKVVYGVWEAVGSIFNNIGKFFGKIFGIDVGDYENVGVAFGKGVAKGEKSWKESKKQDAATESHFGGALENVLINSKTDGKSEIKDSKTQDKINAVSGGGAKNVTINIAKVVERFEVKVANADRKMQQDIQELVEQAMVSVLASAAGR